MKQLRVKPVTLVMKTLIWEDGSSSNKPDYRVFHEGTHIGRIYETPSGGWYWGLDFKAAQGVNPFFGWVEDKETAQREFRECFEKTIQNRGDD